MLIESPFTLEGRHKWPIRGEVRAPGTGQSGRLIVVSHGFKGFKDWGFFPWASRELARAGHTVITFNFSGSGIGTDPQQFTEPDKFRENSLDREIDDLAVVLDSARAGNLPGVSAESGARPALLGHSRGGLVSLVAADRNRDVTHVVTWAGIGSLARRYDEQLRAEWRRRGSLEVVNSRTGQIFEIGIGALDDLEQNLVRYDPINVVARLDIPVLMIHGTADTTIPVSEARELFEAGRPGLSRHLEVPEADHTFGAGHPFRGPGPHLEVVIEATLDFLKR
jgi:pimeloyl-ACP methyl ester carboxylesterase